MHEGEQPAEESMIVAPWSRPARRRGLSPSIIVAGVVGVIGLVLAFLVLTPNNLFRLGTPSLADAKACFAQGDWACARADYRAYLKKYPNDGQAAAVLAAMLSRDGR